VRVILESLPPDTPTDDQLFIAGNFNNWDPGNPQWKLQKDSHGIYYADIPRSEGTLEFKITRGSWGTVECELSGEDISNRTYPYKDLEKIKIDVKAWKDKF
jgi:hypothetical protein